MRCFSIGILLTCVILSASRSEAALQAGAARRSIVPPTPTYMGGFFDRKEKFQGVHDDIFVRALVLDNGQTQIAILACDLIDVDADLTQKTRAAIEEATGIPATHILVCAAHNHSSPSLHVPGRLREADDGFKEFLVKEFSIAAIEAWNARRPARAGYHSGELVGLTRNRQQNNDLIDPQVGVFLVRAAENDDVIAALYNWTAHPVILSSQNLLLSGEFPGAASRAVEGLLGGVALFTQGATGDITLNRQGDPFQEIERIGRTLAGEVIKTAGFIRGSEDITLAATSQTLEFPPRKLPSREDSEALLAERTAALEAAKARGANDAVLRGLEQRLAVPALDARVAKMIEEGEVQPPDHYSAEVQVLQLGDLVIVGMPGEVFVEYGLELKDRVRQLVDRDMMFVGYANGYIGYIVTPRAWETGGYEASVSKVEPTTGRQLTETAVQLVTDTVK